MHFPTLTSGRLIKRYKRFFADVELANGSVVVAHVANTGSMKTCFEPGWTGWLSPATNPERKLRWSLEFTSSGNNLIMINTAHANTLAQEALREKRLAPFAAYDTVLPEQKILDSRFDFKLTQPGLPDYWIEVKNVTLMEQAPIASFPDAVTERGQKHLQTLMQLKRQGYRVAMLYVLSRTDASLFKPAAHIDPTYATLLKEAWDLGVEIYCYRLEKVGEEFQLQTPIEVQLC